jgi:hypothetical protein
MFPAREYAVWLWKTYCIVIEKLFPLMGKSARFKGKKCQN